MGVAGIGFAIAAPVGPIGLLCIQRTLNRGRLSGLVSGLGAAAADAIYGSIAAFGLVLIATFLVEQQVWFGLVGGIFLCYLAVRTFMAPPADVAASTQEGGLVSDFGSTLFLTLTNPVTVLSFVAIFAGLGLATQGEDNRAALLIVAGVFCGSALWWLLLSGGVSLFRQPHWSADHALDQPACRRDHRTLRPLFTLERDDMNGKEQTKPYRIALIAGDGIGQEVVPAAAQVLDASADRPSSSSNWMRAGRPSSVREPVLPAATMAVLRTCDGALFGAVSSPSHRVPGYASPIIAMRRELDLYANLRPVRSTPLFNSRPDIDLLIVRENSEGLYVKQERLEENGQRVVARAACITRAASERIAHVAFREVRERIGARGEGPGSRLTLVHKANVLSVSDGLFRESVLDIAKAYPEVTVEEQLVDSMAYRLILEPERFDVVLAPNLYGDILSDEAAALVGGLGIVPSANMGDSFVLAEPVHGSAPDIAGQGIANPVATIRAAALLLASLGERRAAETIDAAVLRVLFDGPHTRDLGGNASTVEVTREIVRGIGD